MKKTLLAVVTSSLFAASVNAAVVYDKDGQQVDVSGRMEYDAGQLGYKVGSADAQNFGGEGSGRLGVSGKWATGTDVSLIGKVEWQANVESKTDNATNNMNGTGTGFGDTNNQDLQARYGFVGADFGNGVQATIGKSDVAYKALNDTTDIFDLWSADAEYAGSFSASRADDQVNVNYLADGWDLRSSYSFNDAEKVGTVGDKTEDKWSAAAGYTIADTGVKVVTAYEQADGKASGSTTHDSQYGIGLGYTYDAYYVGTNYQQAKFKVEDGSETQKDNIWELAAAYTLDNYTFRAGYDIRDPHNVTADDGYKVKEYLFNVNYAFTPKASVYAEYKLNQAKTGSSDRYDDLYGVGLQYNF